MSWILFALLSALAASLVAIFGKIGLKSIDSTLATMVRSIFMTSFLVLVTLSLGKIKSLSSIDNKSLLFIAFSGIMGALSWLFYFYAIKTGPVSGVISIDKLSVVIAIIFSTIFLGEALTWKVAIGALFITIGALLVAIK
jgi:transporter family protein